MENAQKLSFPAEKNCTFRSIRHDLEEHSSRCPHAKRLCNNCETLTLLGSDHAQSCRGVKIPCPLYCESTIRRDKMALHFGAECPNEVVTCTLPGCLATFLRKESYQHHGRENATNHLRVLWMQFLEGEQTLVEGPIDHRKWTIPMVLPCKSPSFSILGVRGRMYLTTGEVTITGNENQEVFTFRVTMQSSQAQKVKVRLLAYFPVRDDDDEVVGFNDQLQYGFEAVVTSREKTWGFSKFTFDKPLYIEIAIQTAVSHYQLPPWGL